MAKTADNTKPVKKLTKDMLPEQLMQVMKRKGYKETYVKGIVAPNHADVIERIKRPGSFIQLISHEDLGDGINCVTMKLFHNSK